MTLLILGCCVVLGLTVGLYELLSFIPDDGDVAAGAGALLFECVALVWVGKNT